MCSPSVMSFDYIVVGGGTSGLVMANRLTENPLVQVLVLEAGENQIENQYVQIPGLYAALAGTAADWNFATQPQVINQTSSCWVKDY